MANSVAVLVGEAREWVPELINKAKKLKVGPGAEEGVDVSPLAYRDLYDRVH